MEKNVCRPFILYNDFLPPVPEVHEKWEYLSFGYNDGVTVGDNLFRDEKYGYNFQRMWDYYVNHGEQKGEGYSSHILWGLRFEPDNSTGMTDEKFWDDKENIAEYPFLFISLLQFEKKTQTGEVKFEDGKSIEQRITKYNSKIKAITYLTFDKSDLILVMQCEKYEDGADVINRLHYGKDNLISDENKIWLTYSFTVASVKRQTLQEDAVIEKIDGNIQHAYIFVIERHPGSITDIYEKIRNELDSDAGKESILGCNDEVIVIHDVPWSKFLRFFRFNIKTDNDADMVHGTVVKQEHSTSPGWSENLIGITTMIGAGVNISNCESCSRQKDVDEDSTGHGDGGKTDQLLSATMREKCKKIEFVGEGDSIWLEAVKRNIYQTINSLRKFETTPFKDYLFQVAFLPLNMVLDMAQTLECFSSERFIESFYKFMKGLNLYAQNSEQSDRQFVQAPDLKVRIYDAPVKLNAFYNAFIFFIKKYLNKMDQMLSTVSAAEFADTCMNQDTSVHEYEFLACPGVTNNMRVEELFKGISADKRLFLIEMPESQVYCPTAMMAMLAHEVGHFVGKSVRGRVKRVDYVAKVMGLVIVKFIRKRLQQHMSPQEYQYIKADSDYWNETVRTITEYLKEFHRRYPEYIEKVKYYGDSGLLGQVKEVIEKLQNRLYHSDVLMESIIEGTRVILMKQEIRFWDAVLARDYIYWLDNDPKQAENKKNMLQEEIQRSVIVFLSNEMWNLYCLNIYSVTDLVIHLFKECIADLIAILTLRLSLKNYLETFCISDKAQGYDMLLVDKVADIRKCLVICCMIQGEKVNGFCWEDDEIKAVYASDDSELINLWEYIWDFTTKYMGKKNIYADELDKDRYNAIDMLLDREVMDTILDYLQECKSSFVKRCTGDAMCQKKKLEKMYDMFKNNNINILIEDMQEYIAQYLDEMEIRKGEINKKWQEMTKD